MLRHTCVIAALVARGTTVAMGRLPESNLRPSTGGAMEQLRQAFRRPWARFLILFAVPEGAMVLGFLVYFAPALEATGTNPAAAGLVVAAYRGPVPVGTRVANRLASPTPAAVNTSVGAAMGMAGYCADVPDQH